MSKRGRKKKLKLNVKPETLKSVFAVFLLIFGILSLWSLLAPSYNLTSVFYKYLKMFFGYGMYIFPFALIYTGIIMLWPVNYKFLNLRVVIGLYFLFTLISSLSESFIVGKGGSLGIFISSLLSSNIGYIGSLIVLVLAFIATLIFISDVPVPAIHAFFEKISANRKNKLEKEEDEEDFVSEEEDEGYETKVNHGSKYAILPSYSEPLEGEVIMPKTISKKTSDKPEKPTLPYSDKVWDYPSLNLLDEPDNTPPDRGDIKARAKIIEDTFSQFKIGVKVVETNLGPTVTQYALEPDAGIRINAVTALSENLALSLASPDASVRIQAPIPGKSLIGIEVPNNTRSKVALKTLLNSDRMKNSKNKLEIVLGLDISGHVLTYNIARMPHLLVAGATGSGKSIFLNSLIFSILYRNSPDECKLIMIDPKRVELVHYDSIPHLISPVVTDIKKAPAVFKWAVNEMDRRYKLFESAKVNHIDKYNEKSGFQALPNIVIIVDEMAEIMMEEPAEVEKAIQRITQLARAVGIHLVLATQRPSTNVLTGTIKANIPTRISFKLPSQIDSRVIIEQAGAEKLLGKGDMLFVPPEDSKPIRIQGPNVSDSEIHTLVEFLKSQGEPEYNEEVTKAPTKKIDGVATSDEERDDYYEQAVDIVVHAQKASATLLQTRLSVGYARAARILDELEAGGVVSPLEGNKRKVLIKKESPQLEDETTSESNFEISEEVVESNS
jgi:S-DNA-T family DNA segregation ATPase FtsK/SpoIIIE